VTSAVAWRALVDRFFPVAPDAPKGKAGWRAPSVAVAAMAFVTWLQVLRLPNGATVNTLWAEDGNIFLAQAVNTGRLHAFVTPYAGYLHFAPRIIGALAASLPLQWAAAVCGITSAAAVSLLGGFVYRASAGHIPSRQLRAALALTVVVIPVVGFEIDTAACNLHFYLDFAATWAVLWRPPRLLDRITASALVFLAATSDPVLALLLPLALCRLVAVKRWQEAGPVAALVAGLAIQAPVILPVTAHSGGPSLHELAGVLASHVALPFLAGGSLGGRLWDLYGWAAPILASIVVLGAVVLLLLPRRLRIDGVAALAFVGYAAVLTAAPVWWRWGPVFNPVPHGLIGIPARYYAWPLLVLWSAVLVVAASDRVQLRLGQARTTAVQTGVTLWLVALCAADFALPNNTFRNDGPFWDREVTTAAASCRTTHAAAVRISPPPAADYAFTIPCRRLVG
jgi:hypothetical protein